MIPSSTSKSEIFNTLKMLEMVKIWNVFENFVILYLIDEKIWDFLTRI